MSKEVKQKKCPLNFKKVFAPSVIDGSKRQTIRQKRKRPICVGDLIVFYTALRTIHSKKIGEATCKEVNRIFIHPSEKYVQIDNTSLSWDQIGEMSKKDGFSNEADFFDFFFVTYGNGGKYEEFIFTGVLIKW